MEGVVYVGKLLFYLVLVVAAVFLCGICFDYSGKVLIGGDIPFWGDCIAGTALNAVIIPVAIGLWVAETAGATRPLINLNKGQEKPVG